jgi:hypothetical protein
MPSQGKLKNQKLKKLKFISVLKGSRISTYKKNSPGYLYFKNFLY